VVGGLIAAKGGNMDVGFIGLGNMGQPMALRLLEAGHRLVVLDTRAEATEALVAAGAKAASSAKEVGASAGIVFLCLPKPQLVEEVAAAVAGGGEAKLIVDLSTTGPTIETALGGRLQEEGVALLDCPISGGPPKARAGTLSLMVSGQPAAVEKVRSLLDVFGTVFVVSDQPGASQVLKLLNNVLSFTALVASSEVLALGRKSGLAMTSMIEVINASSGRNSATMEKFPRNIMTGGYDFGGAVAIAKKDTMLCLDHARSMGVEMPISEAIAQALARVVDTCGPDVDITNIARYAADRSGVHFSTD
jgi:3-hydroxyisobutyrate dehydrogenase-like beta-hydroxyacid dehydrogenase